jgi:peptidoglycan/xylan/chitin deacetylase (PgdA/CDA1 family)
MQKVVYLTIDDAPTKDFGAKIEYLSSHAIPALIFSIGKHLQAYPDALIPAIQQGYVIGNHSYSHPYFSDLSLDACYEEIVETDKLLEDLYQRAKVARPAKIFRFPYMDKGGHRDVDEYENQDKWPEAYTNPDKKDRLQQLLRQMGYAQPTFANIKQRWFHEHRLADDADVFLTFDQMEYWLGKPAAPYGLSEEAAILSRIEEDEPENGRSLNRADTADIILIHDMEHTTALFYKILDRYIAKNFDFKLPTFA